MTGSTDGIGLHTAKRLARDQAHVILHGRSSESGDSSLSKHSDNRDAKRVEKAKKEIIEETGNRNISSYVYDLSSMDEVRRFAQDLRSQHQSIDVLINNASVFLANKMSID